MDPLTIGVGAISAGLPSLLDIITGASKKRKDAQDAQVKALSDYIDQINGEAGTSSTDSTLFKTGTAALDKQFKNSTDSMTGTAAASGASDEAKLGARAGLDSNYNSAMLALLSQADQRRQDLKNKARELTFQKYGLELGNANQNLGNQQELSRGVAQTLPSLFFNPANSSSTGFMPTAPASPSGLTIVQPPKMKYPWQYKGGAFGDYPTQPNFN